MVGGGFGGKEDITVEIFLGLLAKHTGRPVRLVYTREESLLAHAKRHPFTITHRTGVRRDGRIVAAEIAWIPWNFAAATIFTDVHGKRRVFPMGDIITAITQADNAVTL